MKRFVVLDKKVGETPLQCQENWRATQSPAYQNTPLTYAGRLDPMASGKLLVLIGDECKQKENYLNLDKEYEFEVLFDISSDSGDILGLISFSPLSNPKPDDKKSLPRAALGKGQISLICHKLTGHAELPYPHYSSKTVQGKPLHTWAIEGRLDEIKIPTKESNIHKLKLIDLKSLTHEEVYTTATTKIETIPPVKELSKAIGNDFRRPDIRASWQDFLKNKTNETYQVAKFRCIASSGTYMRTLAEVIAKELSTTGLAYSIHRTKIGKYKPLPFGLGIWTKEY